MIEDRQCVCRLQLRCVLDSLDFHAMYTPQITSGASHPDSNAAATGTRFLDTLSWYSLLSCAMVVVWYLLELAARAAVGAQQSVAPISEAVGKMARSTRFRNGTGASMFAQSMEWSICTRCSCQ